MKKHQIFLLLIPLLFACKANLEKESNKEPLSANDATMGKDYFEHKVEPILAKHFEVSYHGNYKVIKTDATFFPNGKEAAGEKRQDVLVLVQKGTTPPALTGALANATIISIPVQTAAVNVQHSESFLRELGLVDRINAIGGLYSYDDEMRNKAMSGELGQISYSWHGPPNMEVLLERKPEVFLMTLANLDHKSSLDKCRQLGIPTAAVFDWAEEEYLARAEWIKFYSLFFNAEEKANQVFQNIKDRIESLKDLTANLGKKESAMWGYYSSKQKWVMSIDNFPGQYLRDAGLENALLANTKTNANGKQTLSTEELLAKGKDIDHWMIGDIHASPLPQEVLMKSFKSWQSDKLYHNMTRVDPKSNSSDWYATAIVRPDTVLADLIKMIHPELLEDYDPVFMGLYDKSTQSPREKELQ